MELTNLYEVRRKYLYLVTSHPITSHHNFILLFILHLYLTSSNLEYQVTQMEQALDSDPLLNDFLPLRINDN